MKIITEQMKTYGDILTITFKIIMYLNCKELFFKHSSQFIGQTLALFQLFMVA